jgi:transcriptional regulator with PAS, ATPase and Fis domain
MPGIILYDEAKELLMRYRWPGNIRQLKNITEQISVIEKSRDIGADILRNYIPFHVGDHLPAIINQNKKAESDFSNEREILYKVLFDMKRDMNDLKKIVMDLMQHGENIPFETEEHARIIKNLYNDLDPSYEPIPRPTTPVTFSPVIKEQPIQDTEEFVEESLSLESKEIELIRKALERHAGKRKHAAQELGISERTLYRKIKEYNIE